MQHSKFCTLFKRISTTETHAFYKYLKQMHGAQTLILRCYEYVRKFHPHQMEDPGLDLAQVYSVLFRAPIPKDKQHASRKNLSNTLSELYRHLRRFLLHEKIRTDPVEEQALWLLVLQERGWEEEFSREAVDFYRDAQQAKQKDTIDSINLLRAGYFHRQYLSTLRKREDGATLTTYLEELEVCYDTLRLKLFCEFTNLKQPVPDKLVTSVVLEKAPLLHLYQAIYQLLVSPSKTHFEIVRSLLTQTAAGLAPASLIEILKYMHSYGAALARTEIETDFANKLHAFNKFTDEYHFFELKGLIGPSTFNGAINIACAVKDYDWANALIQKLTGAMPRQAITLAKADVLFAQKKYTEVLRLLNLPDFRNFLDIMRARLLIIRSYYCSGDPEQVSICYNNFDSWLHRHQDKYPTQAAAASAFLDIFNGLVQEKISQEALLKRFNANPSVYCKIWLREQITHYKSRYARRH